jgi:hypothetical protein
VAALFGLDEFRSFRIHRDSEIEAMLLEGGEKFWRNHVLARVAPPIGISEAATDYLKQRFPRQVEMLRPATEEEEALVADYDQAHDIAETAEDRKKAAANALKEAIGEAEGLMSRIGKVTWKKDADSVGTDWEAVARRLASEPCPRDPYPNPHPDDCGICGGSGFMIPHEKVLLLNELSHQLRKVTREGARKLLLPRRKAGK